MQNLAVLDTNMLVFPKQNSPVGGIFVCKFLHIRANRTCFIALILQYEMVSHK